ncbi:maleylacetoacetate isomerase [Hirschia baltica]|uniref:Maleylacetoacetate isomerase n=1 Tax=Hirschia baltica (strain ATCC 49814 / DSM 5838 / IFAM 1418) TaxID=582402 RepID=C6XPS1_HIRBI|nr:maleylacetoacetate isomerase [Hirschia baltica]ACT60336.1 maleylacetoacetate isomerase [Hirschia baltica ATCC 49814]
MRLYSYYRSSTSYRVRIALNLKGVNYDYAAVDLKCGENKSDDFAAVNPHKTLPVLEAGDVLLVQSPAILDWLEINYPEPSFIPADKAKAQIARELYYAIVSETHAPNNLPVLQYLKSEFGADQRQIEKWIQTWNHRTLEAIERRLSVIGWENDILPFGVPTLFEIALIPLIYNANRWNTDLSNFPIIQRVDAHCCALPSFKKARPEIQPDAPKE